MKLFQWLLTFVIVILSLAAGLVFFMQSSWAKDKIGLVLHEIALHQGVQLKIEKIEGEIPLKWKLTNVHLEVNDTDTLDIDNMAIRIAILPLLKGQIAFSYVSIGKVEYAFTEKKGEKHLTPPLLSVKRIHLKQVDVLNLTTGEKATYSLSGSYRLKEKRAHIRFHLHSLDVEARIGIDGDRKKDLLDITLDTEVKSRKAFSPFFTLPTDSISAKGKGQTRYDFQIKNFNGNFTYDEIHGTLTYAPEITARIQYKEFTLDLQDKKATLQGLIHGSADFEFAKNQLHLNNISLAGLDTTLIGDLTVGWNRILGNLHFQSSYIGQVGGVVSFEGESASFHAIGKNFRAGPFLAEALSFDAHFNRYLQGKFELETQKGYFHDLELEKASANLTWNGKDWDFALQGNGTWKKELSLTTSGHLDFSPLTLTCQTLEGRALDKAFHLENPFLFAIHPQHLSLENLKLQIEEGFLHADVELSAPSCKIDAKANRFPLDFLTFFSPRFYLEGLSSFDIDLQGTSTDLVGHCNAVLERADIYPAGAETPIQTKASFQSNLHHNTVQLHTHIVATDEQFVEIGATLPLSYELLPFHLTLLPEKTLAGHCTIEGHIEQLFDFVNIGTQRFGGFLSTKLLLSGTKEKPTLFGPLTIQGGFYKNYIIGLSFVHADITAQANGSTLDISKIDVTDEFQGRCEATGNIQLLPKIPYYAQGHISHFRVIQFDWLSSACTGPFTISGNLDQGLAQGSLTIDEAEVHIPDRFPFDLPALPVTFINKPSSHPTHPLRPPYPFHYDFTIHGDHDIHLTGRGINAELSGDLTLTGKNLNVTPLGTLQTIKGKFSFAGRDFTITQGELSFTEKGGFINLASQIDLSDLQVKILFRGSFQSPELIFQSSPPLPTSSIVSRILFNKDVSELTPIQAVQLANTIVSLSGSAAPDVLGTIRKNLGIDRLNISSSDETGKVAVQIGKYLTEGVMITLTQGTEGTPKVLVEVELKGGFVLQAETQEDDQGKFSFKWNKNY